MGAVPIVRQRLAREKNMRCKPWFSAAETFQNEVEDLCIPLPLTSRTALIFARSATSFSDFVHFAARRYPLDDSEIMLQIITKFDIVRGGDQLNLVTQIIKRYCWSMTHLERRENRGRKIGISK